MSKNSNFDSDRRRPELNEYISNEITQYYGEDVISDIESSSAPIPPKRRRNSRLISAFGIICAVMFLTGAVIFSGVFFTSGISVFESSTSHDIESDADISTHSDKTESLTDADTDNSIYSSNYNSQNSIVSKYSADNSSSDSNTFSTDYENNINIYDDTSADRDTDTLGSSHRTDYFSLPEYPDEGNISEINTDVNNNSSTNPNDNVTTGKKFRANIGMLLMILSLITAYALYHMRTTSAGDTWR